MFVLCYSHSLESAFALLKVFFPPGQYDTGSSSGNSRGDLTDREKRDIKSRVEEGVNKAMYFV